MTSDYAHRWTDKELAQLERRIHSVYGQASKELRDEVDEYFEKLKRRDNEMRALLAQGKITEEKYLAWRKAQIGRGERVEHMIDELSERITAVNGHAMEYVRDGMTGVYAENHNYTAYTIERVHGNVGFTLYDEETVRRLLIADPDLFPAPSVDIPVDLRWNRTKLQDALVAGIIKGESLDKIADRMMAVTDMTEVAARRNARTAYTSAQNAGRQKAMERAAEMGIDVRKRWIATKDMRTRHEHGMTDGQVVPYDEPFSVDGYPMMYPGDRRAPGRLVYNCRCTMRTVDPIDEQLGPRQMRVRNPFTGKNELVSEMTYSEWKKQKRAENPERFDAEKKKVENRADDKKQYEKDNAILGRNGLKSFEKYQEIKYNGDWEQYRSYVRAITNGELTTLASYDLYSKTGKEVDDKLVGVTATNGVTITGKSNHFVARIIGSVEQRRSGVTIDDVIAALTDIKSEVRPERVTASGKRSQKIRREPVEVSINPDTGMLVQANPWIRSDKNDGKSDENTD